MRVKINSRLLWFFIPTLSDWFKRKLVPLSRPIRSNRKKQSLEVNVIPFFSLWKTAIDQHIPLVLFVTAFFSLNRVRFCSVVVFFSSSSHL